MATAATEFEMGLLAGTARVVATPPLDVQVPGETSPFERFQCVHDDLFVRALVLQDGRYGPAAAVVACDAIGFGGAGFVAEVRWLVTEQTGLPPERVLLAASHTHTAPWTLRRYDVQIDPRWLRVWQQQIADAVALAYRRRQPAQLALGRGDLRVAQNRRVLCADGRVYRNWQRPKPAPVVRDGPIDPALTVLLVEDLDGRPLATLTNYTMHPVTAMSLPTYSADFPGVAMRLVEQALSEDAAPNGCIVLFTNGAAGDVNPPQVRRNLQDTDQVGRIVGGAVLSVAAGLHRHAEARRHVPIAGTAAQFHPPFRAVPPAEESLARWQQAMARAREASAQGDETARRAAMAEGRMAQRLYHLAVLTQEDDPVEVQALRLGDLALVGVPGELFVEIGLAIKRASPAPQTAIVGYANNWQGYFPTPKAFDEGAYEVDLAPHSRYTAAAGQMIQETALRLLHELFATA